MIKKALYIFYIVVIAVMACATFVEKSEGTVFASSCIYGSWWFAVLWALLAAAGVAWIVLQRVRKWEVLLLHLSFVVILSGAFLTHVTSFGGFMHLRKGETSNVYYKQVKSDGTMSVALLPFRLHLDDFRVVCYRGMKAAADYQTFLTVYGEGRSQKAVVAMNKVFVCRGIRFYQNSYDEDGEGVTLGVGSDPYGIPVTYTGYFLLFFSLVAMLANPKGTFRRLLRSDVLRKGGLAVALFLAFSISASASTGRVQETAAYIYNNVEFATLLFIFNLALGFIFLAVTIGSLAGRCCADRRAKAAFLALFALSFLVLTFALALRWIASGNIPMSNGYEVMLFAAWLVQCFSLLACRKVRIVLSFGFLLSGFFLLVCHISKASAAISPLMPVLNSPLLCIHVGIIMMSYALLAMTFVCGIAGLSLSSKSRELQVLSQLFLYPAIVTLAIGIFVGAIWANVSWGNYWSWDPKETWALITLMVYAASVHTQSIPQFRSPRLYHLFMVAAFLTILMTFFGVNYFLGGIHSYA